MSSHKSKALKNQGAPTPFQMIGSSVKSGLGKAIGKVMAPSIKVGKLRDAEMQEMSRKAKSGEFNQ